MAETVTPEVVEPGTEEVFQRTFKVSFNLAYKPGVPDEVSQDTDPFMAMYSMARVGSISEDLITITDVTNERLTGDEAKKALDELNAASQKRIDEQQADDDFIKEISRLLGADVELVTL